MPRFHYKAVNPTGELLEGELQGRNQQAVIRRLQDLGHTPILVGEAAEGRGGWARAWLGRRRARMDLGRFTRDLANLLKAGIPLERALEMLAEITEEVATAELISRLLDRVRGGAGLAAAMEAEEGAFGRFYVNMVKAAEAGGALEDVLARLAEYLEKYQALRGNIKTALIYPGILVGVTVLSLIVLVTFVIPQFAALFEEMGKALPLPSRIVMAVGKFLQVYGWLVVASLSMFALYLRHLLAKPPFRYRWDRWLLRLPLVGDLIAKMETAIFARTLGTLLGGGVPLLAGLAIVKETVTNRVLAETLGSVAEEVQQGRGLAEPIARSGRFPRLAAHLVRVGEETGQLEAMLLQLAATCDGEVNRAVQRMLALLEPLLIIGLGLVIGSIILSILVAVLSVNELAFQPVGSR